MTTSKNSVTGDSLISRPTTKAYSAGWDIIFGKQKSLYDEYVEMAEILEENNKKTGLKSDY